MTKEEYEKQKNRVEQYRDIWEELGFFEQALQEFETGSYDALCVCINDYGLKTSVKKLVEARIQGLRNELDEV